MTTPVQSAYVQVDATSPAVVALPGSATSGNTIVLAISWYDGAGGTTMQTPADANGTYQSAINPGLNAVGCSIAVFYVQNCSAGTHSTTVNTSNAAPDGNCYMSVALYEIPGLTTTPFDKENSATTINGGAGQTTQATGTTGTLSQASEWVLVLCGVDDNPGVANEMLTVPAGYTVDPNIPSSFQDTNDHIGLQVGWLDVSATTALNPSFTITSRASLTSLYAGITTWLKASTAVTATTWLWV